MDIWSLVILFGLVHGVFLGVVLLLKKKSTAANRIFAICLFLLSTYLIEFFGVISGKPVFEIAYLSYPALFFIGPLFYIHQVALTRKLTIRDPRLLLLATGLIAYLVFLPFYQDFLSVPPDTCPVGLMENHAGVSFLTKPLAFFSYSFVFVLLTFLRLNKIEVPSTNHKEVFQNRVSWFKKFALALVIFLGLSAIYEVLVILFPALYSPLSINIENAILALLIHSVGYASISVPSVFSNVKQVELSEKYKTSALDSSMSNALLEELQLHMNVEKPYLQSDLNIQMLADQLGVSRHRLSQVINQKLNVSFFDFINAYRIEAAKTCLKDYFDERSIQNIAFDVGFSNKVSFYRAFKKQTNSSPQAYREKLKTVTSDRL